jgi:hypothetical protein
VADAIETWFEARAIDGINLAFRLTEDLANFVDSVIPILQRRGVYRIEYEAATLRGNLGLPIPVNRYSSDANADSGWKAPAAQLSEV